MHSSRLCMSLTLKISNNSSTQFKMPSTASTGPYAKSCRELQWKARRRRVAALLKVPGVQVRNQVAKQIHGDGVTRIRGLAFSIFIVVRGKLMRSRFLVPAVVAVATCLQLSAAEPRAEQQSAPFRAARVFIT